MLDSDFWRPSLPFPKNKGLFLVARRPDDIVVLRRPPWWTPTKFLVAATIMAGVIVMILIWNAALRVLVERKSREVAKAKTKKLESELRIAERTRLAADLHDSLSQNLTVIGYQVSAAKNTLGGKDPATTECLDTVSKMIRSCRTDLRRCLWDLRNDVLDEPDFAEAIRKTVAPVAGTTSVEVQFEGPRAAISDLMAHGVLNAVRELVANAVRHGEATTIRIAGEVRAGTRDPTKYAEGFATASKSRIIARAGRLHPHEIVVLRTRRRIRRRCAAALRRRPRKRVGYPFRRCGQREKTMAELICGKAGKRQDGGKHEHPLPEAEKVTVRAIAVRGQLQRPPEPGGIGFRVLKRQGEDHAVVALRAV